MAHKTLQKLGYYMIFFPFDSQQNYLQEKKKGNLETSQSFIKVQYFTQHKTIAGASLYHCVRSINWKEIHSTIHAAVTQQSQTKKLYFQLFRILWTVSGVNSNDKDLHLCVTLFFLKRWIEKQERMKHTKKNFGKEWCRAKQKKRCYNLGIVKFCENMTKSLNN